MIVLVNNERFCNTGNDSVSERFCNTGNDSVSEQWTFLQQWRYTSNNDKKSYEVPELKRYVLKHLSNQVK